MKDEDDAGAPSEEAIEGSFGREGSFGSFGKGNDGKGIERESVGILKDDDDAGEPSDEAIEGSFGKEGSVGNFGSAKEGIGTGSAGIGIFVFVSVVFPLIVDVVVNTVLGISNSISQPAKRFPRSKICTSPRVPSPNHPAMREPFNPLNINHYVISDPNRSSKIRKKFVCNDLHFKAPYVEGSPKVEAVSLQLQSL